MLAPTNCGSTIIDYTVISSPITTDTQLTVIVYKLDNRTAYTFTILATNAISNLDSSNPCNLITLFSQPEKRKVVTGSYNAR